MRGERSFKLPYVNGKLIVPVMTAIFIYFFWSRIISAFENVRTEGLKEVLFLGFILLAIILSVLTFIRNYSVIPILGVLFCSYLLIEIPAFSWLLFFAWMGLGLLIYFIYGYRKSKLTTSQNP
jgi:hypothetical protein